MNQKESSNNMLKNEEVTSYFIGSDTAVSGFFTDFTRRNTWFHKIQLDIRFIVTRCKLHT